MFPTLLTKRPRDEYGLYLSQPGSPQRPDAAVMIMHLQGGLQDHEKHQMRHLLPFPKR